MAPCGKCFLHVCPGFTVDSQDPRNVGWVWQPPCNLSAQKWKWAAPEANKLTSPCSQMGKLSSSEKPSLNTLGWSKQTPSTLASTCTCVYMCQHAEIDTATSHITCTYHAHAKYMFLCYDFLFFDLLLLLLFWIIWGLHNRILKNKDQKGVGRNKFDICQLYHLFVLLFLQHTYFCHCTKNLITSE